MRLSRISLAAVLASSLLTFSVAAQTGQREPLTSTPALSISAIRIDNFGRVNPSYFRGAQPKGRDYADLHALGIRTIVDFTRDGDSSERMIVEGAGMKFYRIPMTTHEPPSREQLGQFLQIVNDPANQPVYVHCQGGRHRTGVMTAVYRMTGEGWTADRAFAEMKQYKFGADFLHPEFKSFVYEYGANLAATPPAAAGVAAAKTGG